MSKADRLQLVLDLEKKKKDQAAKMLAEAISNLQKAQDSLSQLTEYRTDYLNQAQEIGKQGVSAIDFRNRQRLADRIMGAMEGQAQSINLYERQLEQVRKHYEKVYARVRSIELLIEKSIMEEERKENVREQKMLDDFSQAQAFRRRTEIN
ncbi:flagellar export protein FliJ [Litoribrevibacter albus]|uniref:Flagellar FliJ protein n=1 Tax=Litoribrevibacter albus TaxID=1473156 RepID=A0AA37SD43_9GAMM|nr:flagellar export protein FliJ [Litoribrevibacter albus]GLQ32331.1 flagellar protein FliJ [Litoribrevibacter albus]